MYKNSSYIENKHHVIQYENRFLHNANVSNYIHNWGIMCIYLSGDECSLISFMCNQMLNCTFLLNDNLKVVIVACMAKQRLSYWSLAVNRIELCLKQVNWILCGFFYNYAI